MPPLLFDNSHVQGVSNETRFFAAASTHLCYKLGQIRKLVYQIDHFEHFML